MLLLEMFNAQIKPKIVLAYCYMMLYCVYVPEAFNHLNLIGEQHDHPSRHLVCRVWRRA